MTKTNQEAAGPLSPAELIARADAEGLALHASLAAVPKGTPDQPPEWITIFPTSGKIETRDQRQYDINAQTLMAVFKADGLEIPVDLNHSTDAGIFGGGRSDAVGWVTELRLGPSGGLEGKVDWLAEGVEMLSGRKYRYTSPSFYKDQFGKATRLKAVALVTAPALARQPALAAATSAQQETSMKTIAEALGLTAGATEAECLSALSAKLTGLVSKETLDGVTAQLSAASTELATLKAEARQARVDGVIEAALAARKILPAEKDEYTALCATDDGLASVEKLFGKKSAVLQPSGLEGKTQPGAGVDASDGVKLGLAAQAYMAEQAAKGITISAAEAVNHLTGEAA
jgi:phage I-like protein